MIGNFIIVVICFLSQYVTNSLVHNVGMQTMFDSEAAFKVVLLAVPLFLSHRVVDYNLVIIMLLS
jgi:fatty-acid desaturase